jgi:hypothetical protein
MLSLMAVDRIAVITAWSRLVRGHASLASSPPSGVQHCYQNVDEDLDALYRATRSTAGSLTPTIDLDWGGPPTNPTTTR